MASTMRSEQARDAAGPVRWVARIWAEVAIVGYLLWQAVVRAPVEGEGDYWFRLAGLVVLVLIVVGHLLTWRWEIQGATVMAVGGCLLALITSFRFHTLGETAAVLLAFTGPAALYWWIWQRERHPRHVLRLAVLVGCLVAATLGAGVWAERTANGTFHPQSTLAQLPDAPVVWIWSGSASPTTATVVARVRDPGVEVRLAMAAGDDPADPQWAAAAQRPAEDPGLVRFEVADLVPGTWYRYAVEVDGTVVEERSGRVRTLPEGPASFTVALGSCLQVGSNGQSLDRMRASEPDLVLFTGDFAYEDFWTDDRSAFRDMYDTQLTQPAMDALVRSAPIGYVWDDHDFGPNDADSTAASGPAAQVVYRQAVPHGPLPAGAGPEAIYQSFTMGRVRFVLTDSRSERSPRAAPDDANKTMLGARQLKWLADELAEAAQRGQAVVLVTSVPWNGAPAEGADDWAGYTTERTVVADLIAEAGVADQLLLVAGDAHMVAIDDGTHTDFSTAQVGGFPLMHAAALDRPGSVKGGSYSEGAVPGAGQFGLVEVADDGTDITIRLSGLDWTGAELVGYRFTITPGDLAR